MGVSVFNAAMTTIGSSVVNGSGGDDYFTKVMPIPILNLFAHKFDAWAERLPQWLTHVIQPRFNRIHMALFVVLTAVGLVTTNVKAGALNNAKFYKEDVVRKLDISNRDDRCAANRPWCTPFSFVAEISRWTD